MQINFCCVKVLRNPSSMDRQNEDHDIWYKWPFIKDTFLMWSFQVGKLGSSLPLSTRLNCLRWIPVDVQRSSCHWQPSEQRPSHPPPSWASLCLVPPSQCTCRYPEIEDKFFLLHLTKVEGNLWLFKCYVTLHCWKIDTRPHLVTLITFDHTPPPHFALRNTRMDCCGKVNYKISLLSDPM